MIDFIGIGAQKSGTSWLYENLNRHNKIRFPGGKEIHFWDMHYEKGISWYLSLFQDIPGKVNGEITPAYAIINQNLIRECFDLNKHLKIIYIIRNPIERAWSSALMALNRAEMTINEASDQWFIDHFKSSGSLNRGDYEKCIKNWCSVFPPKQILILRYELIYQNPYKVLKTVCQHIDVDSQFFDSINEGSLRNYVRKGPGYQTRQSLLDFLVELYQPKIESLSKYLHEDISDWLP